MESSRTYGHVGALALFDPSTAPGGAVTSKDLCRIVGSRIDRLPPFQRRLVSVPLGLDLPYWIEDPDFDLDFHIRDSAVPPPGNERQLAETVARIFARPLDRNRPLWEIYLIHGLPEGHVALLTKIHHSVVDGVSGNEILSVLLDPSREGREIPDAPRIRPDRVPSDVSMAGRGALGVVRHPLRMLRSVPKTLPHLTELPGVAALPGGPTVSKDVGRFIGPGAPAILEATTARAPRTPFNGPISPHRRFAFGQLPLAAVKALKNEYGTTVNDVVVSLCAGAVREWLLARNALPEDPLVAMVPMSVRTKAQQGTFGNRVSMMFVPIATDEPDPRARLRKTHELLRGAKERHSALPAALLTDATAFIPPALAALAARTAMDILGRTRPPVNLVISNVPGPRSPLYLAGAQLQAHYPVSVVVDGVGLNITVMSYRDHLDFGIVADREQVDGSGRCSTAWPRSSRRSRRRRGRRRHRTPVPGRAGGRAPRPDRARARPRDR